MNSVESLPEVGAKAGEDSSLPIASGAPTGIPNTIFAKSKVE